MKPKHGDKVIITECMNTDAIGIEGQLCTDWHTYFIITNPFLSPINVTE